MSVHSFNSRGRDGAGIVKEKRRRLFEGCPCLVGNVSIDNHRKKAKEAAVHYGVTVSWDWLTSAVYGPATMAWPEGSTTFDDEFKRQMTSHVETRASSAPDQGQREGRA